MNLMNMAEKATLIFIIFILVTINCLPQEPMNKLLNNSEFKPNNEIRLNLLNLSVQATQREDIKNDTFAYKDKTEFSNINTEAKSVNVHVEVKTNLARTTKIIDVDSSKEFIIQEQNGTIVDDVKRSHIEKKLDTDGKRDGNDFVSDSNWNTNVNDSEDDEIMIDDLYDINSLKSGYNEWIENHNKSDVDGKESLKQSSVERYFPEDVKVEKPYPKNVEGNIEISGLKGKEITMNPRIIVYESSASDISQSRMTIFNDTEERNDHPLLKRFARGTCKECYICPFPKYLVHSKLHCSGRKGVEKCAQKCVFGYTSKKGTKRMYACDLKKGGWGADKKITDCKPFIDCSIKLKPGGKMRCYTNYLHQGNKCYVKCKGYGGKETVKAKKYTCNIEGKWEPKLPHCASPGTGKKLVPMPKDVKSYIDKW